MQTYFQGIKGKFALSLGWRQVFTQWVWTLFAGFCIMFLAFGTHGERRGSIQLLSSLYSIKIQRTYFLFFGFALRVQLSPSILSNNLLKISSSYIFQ